MLKANVFLNTFDLICQVIKCADENLPVSGQSFNSNLLKVKKISSDFTYTLISESDFIPLGHLTLTR